MEAGRGDGSHQADSSAAGPSASAGLHRTVSASSMIGNPASDPHILRKLRK